MKVAYAVGALVLAANDVDPRWVAWMIVGAVLLAGALALLVRLVARMVRGRDLGALWVVWLWGGLVAVWVAVGWPVGWV